MISAIAPCEEARGGWASVRWLSSSTSLKMSSTASSTSKSTRLSDCVGMSRAAADELFAAGVGKAEGIVVDAEGLLELADEEDKTLFAAEGASGNPCP